MINPLAIATRGRISNSVSRSLTLATIGWILSLPVNIPMNDGGHMPIHEIISGGQIKNIKAEQIRKRLLQEDEEILSIIKIFVQCQ